MKVKDVPQDRGMIGNDIFEVCYAVDKDGRYQLTPSAGWEPKNITNDQAWELLDEKVREAFENITAGRWSPLAYHMARNQMNVGLLASYMKMSRWRIRRHLKPTIFNKLKSAVLKQYADVLGISVEILVTIPEKPESAMHLDD